MPATQISRRAKPQRPPVPGNDQFAEAAGRVEEAAARLFDLDARVHSVGVGVSGNGTPIYRAVRNVKKIVAQAAKVLAAGKLPIKAAKELPFPVKFVDAENDAAPLYRMPLSGAVTLAGAAIPEQNRHRPLVCGLQIQNFDDDDRQNVIDEGVIIIGSIGCFVKKNSGAGTFILSNNHVVAGENRGKTNDRILQSGAASFAQNLFVAKLGSFVKLKFSPANASISAGTVDFNDVDAGIARLAGGVSASNAYLPTRSDFQPPKKIGTAKADDNVSKVGRTTGATRGVITSTSVVVGPVEYDGKPAWFRNSIEIEGFDGAFSDNGDSGSAIVNEQGELVGLLYAGNGSQTYACPIASVMSALGIKLV